MPVDGRPQVVHDGLADPVREKVGRRRARRWRPRSGSSPRRAREQPQSSSGIAASRTTGSRNDGTTPSPAENRIRKRTRELRRYRRKSRKSRRRFALRTSGSAGRSGGSMIVSAPKRRPGIRRECLPRVGPGRALDGSAHVPSASTAACSRSVRARASSPVGSVRSTSIGSPISAASGGNPMLRRPSALRVSRNRTGQQGGARRQRHPRRTAQPRAFALDATLREEADDLARLERRDRRLDRGRVASSPHDRDRPDGAEPPGERRVAPELGLAEEVDLARDHRRHHERVEDRVVIAGDHERAARRHVLLPAHLEPVDRPDHRRQRAPVGLVAQ